MIIFSQTLTKHRIITCSAFSALSQQVPDMTTLIAPASTLHLSALFLDLLSVALACLDAAETLASAFHKTGIY